MEAEAGWRRLTRPKVFKMGGAWVWVCHDANGIPIGDEFHEGQWRNPWDACLGAAIKHHATWHNDSEPVDEWEDA